MVQTSAYQADIEFKNKLVAITYRQRKTAM